MTGLPSINSRDRYAIRRAMEKAENERAKHLQAELEAAILLLRSNGFKVDGRIRRERNYMTEALSQKIARDYRAGASVDSIEEKHQVARPQVYRVLRSLNVPFRNRSKCH